MASLLLKTFISPHTQLLGYPHQICILSVWSPTLAVVDGAKGVVLTMKVRENTQKLRGEFGSVLRLLKPGLQSLHPWAGLDLAVHSQSVAVMWLVLHEVCTGTDTNISACKSQSGALLPWNQLIVSLWRNSWHICATLAPSTPLCWDGAVMGWCWGIEISFSKLLLLLFCLCYRAGVCGEQEITG